MVIKDLLNKVSKPSSESDPKVAALREKLQKLQQTQSPAQPAQQPTPAAQNASPQQKEVTTPDELEHLAKASLDEQKRFAQNQDPNLILKEERTQKLVTNQVSELIEVNTELQKRLKQLEQEKQRAKQELEQTQNKNAEIEEKMKLIDQRLEKFMGLYEIITNQYNPFHEAAKKGPLPHPEELLAETPAAPAPTPAEKARVKLADGLTGQEAEVEFEQGRISSDNAQKMAQLLAELEAAENEKQTAPEPEKIVAKEEETAKQTTVELHTMLEGFEARMKGYLDEALQEKLHTTFAHLEEVLNEEISNAVKNEVSKLKDTEDIITSALKEIESLQSTDEEFTKVQQEVVHDLKATDDQIKAIPPNLYFRLADGRVLKSKHDLVLALKNMPEDAYKQHVSDEHNHFADWLTLALEDSVGEKLRGKSREEMAALLQEE